MLGSATEFVSGSDWQLLEGKAHGARPFVGQTGDSTAMPAHKLDDAALEVARHDKNCIGLQRDRVDAEHPPEARPAFLALAGRDLIEDWPA
jgi:hypothetical protein